MIKLYLFILFFIANYCFASSLDHFSLKQESDSVAFMLPGQGSCVAIVKRIEGENLAVVLDAGTSSQQMHVKFLSDATPSHFLSPKTSAGVIDDSFIELEKCRKRSRHEVPVQQKEGYRHIKELTVSDGAAFQDMPEPEVVVCALAPLNVNKINTPQRLTLQDQIITCQKETVSIDLGGKLNKLLAELHVTKMLVLLSHPDTDHTNLIKNLPDVPAIFCVGGSLSIKKEAAFQQLLMGKKHAFRFDTFSLPLVVNTACGDFLSELLAKNDVLDLQYFKNTQVVQKLNFLHLWLLNPHNIDSNSQSYILSATLQQQNMSMVFCGDATASTFNMLQSELGKKGMPIDDIVRRLKGCRDHNVFFSLPHHGSSRHFPQQIFNMFQPSAYCVSAGNGASFPHPHRDLISYIMQNTNSRNVDFFWRSYALTAQSSLCTFARTTHGVGKDHKILPILHRNKPNQPLVLGTNITGTLYMDTRGVFSQDQTNSVQVAGCNYSIEHNSHVFSGVLQNEQFLFDAQYNTLKDAGLFRVSDQDKILYKDNQPYAKIYYSPVSKKWLGYLLHTVESTPMNLVQDGGLDENTNFGHVVKTLFEEDLLETEHLPIPISVKA
jgi:beta-lactamase superfamily II metal-dependent hydrolase